MNEELYAQVAVENTIYHFDKLFTYRVPESLRGSVVPGVRVSVPFGAGNRRRVGLVFSLSQEGGERAKDVDSVLDREVALSQDMLDLSKWMKDRYYCTLFEAAKLMIPTGYHLKLRDSYVLSSDFKDFDRENYTDGQWRAILLLRNAGKSLPMEKLTENTGLLESDPEFQQLVERGIIRKVNTAMSRVKDATSKMVRPILDFSGSLTPRQRDVYQTLLDAGEASERELCYFTGASSSVVRALVDKGAAEAFEYEVYRRPDLLQDEEISGNELVLSPSQEQVLEDLWTEYQSVEGPRSALLYGITGSGKTSVFLKLIERVREQGKGVIVMVPEISLTAQTIRQFHRWFGDGIALFHSGLSLGERLDEWKRVRRGEATIVVGTRSAVFAPVRDLGLIVMDEEQEHTYRSESAPRYAAHEVARQRAAENGSLLLLASATPSTESFYAAQNGRTQLVRLTQRYGGNPLPSVQIVDMRAELASGNPREISLAMEDAIRRNLDAGKQTILLLNRRGYQTMAQCDDCREVLKCPKCSVPMVYHKAGHKLLCHYCGTQLDPPPKTCPACGGKLLYRGFGTQKAEEELAQLFPEARVLRMDQDSTAAKDAHEKLLAKFARHEYDIMVGTQMVAKGLDFEDVTLVGVLGIDSLLFAQGFRAYETVFSLITQVVGRSGRAKDPGFAIIQTTDPDNPVLNLAAAQDYDAFFEQEIAYRKLGLYPPFCGLCVVGFSGPKEIEVARAAARFSALLGRQAAQQPDLPLRVLGPTPGNIEKINENYRYKLTIKCRADKRFRDLVRQTLGLYEQEKLPSKATVVVDMHSDGDI